MLASLENSVEVTVLHVACLLIFQKFCFHGSFAKKAGHDNKAKVINEVAVRWVL